MNRISRVHYYTITILVLLSSIVFSAGISVDAGLTPAEDRWIFRSQVRYTLNTGEIKSDCLRKRNR